MSNKINRLLSERTAVSQNSMHKHSIICSKAEYKRWISYERKKYKSITILDGLFRFSEDDLIWQYQKRLRKTELYLNTNRKIRYLFCRVLLNRMQFLYGMNVKLNSCGKGLKIMHIGSILTNGDIGEDCSLHVNSMIVSGGSSQQNPVIGKNVVVGVGAAIVGGVVLGDGIAVGANSVVTQSFTEKGITIAGVPAKKISDHGSDAWKKSFVSDVEV